MSALLQTAPSVPFLKGLLYKYQRLLFGGQLSIAKN